MSRATAKRVLRIEAKALDRLAGRVGPSFDRAVSAILKSRGRVVVTGMGKSGLVGQKIAATLSSTGTPAFYLHPAEAMHGDLGMVTRSDVVLCLSNSGETGELKDLMPLLKKIGCRVILFTGNLSSSLSGQADVAVDVGVSQEACPLNLTPTASTTAALGMGDALAVALLEKRRFTAKDFALTHPGGDLGRRLQQKVSEVMRRGRAVPKVGLTAGFKQLAGEINRKRVGCACVVDGKGRLAGIVVDGDLRRALLKDPDIRRWKASNLRSPRPRTVSPEATLGSALQMMEERAIYQLIVVDAGRRPVGLLHLHDLLGRGQVRIS